MFGDLGKALGVLNPTAMLGTVASVGGSLLGYKGQKEANETSIEEAAKNREFNSAEAAKQRAWQEQMRSTGYQTAMADLKAAGLNPMLAYSQGPAAMPTGANASATSMPQISNKMQAALSASATAAQIANINAATEKTKADTDVSTATAKQVEAQTHLTSTSATESQQRTENLKEQIAEIRESVKLKNQQGITEQQRRVLMSYDAQLKQIQAEVENERIPLVKAQTALTNVQRQLAQYDIAGARNKSSSEETWWGRNVRPYIQDAGRVTNSATSIYQLRR